MLEIDVDISNTGEVTIEGKSANLGADCRALTAEIEKALGTVTSSQTKPEFHKAKQLVRKAGA